MIKLKRTIYLFLFILITSCSLSTFIDIDNERTGGLRISEDFNWSISRNRIITVRVDSEENCLVEVYDEDPRGGGELIASGIAGNNLDFKTVINVAEIIESFIAKCYWTDGKVSYETLLFDESEYASCNFKSQYASSEELHNLTVNADRDMDNIPDGFDQYPDDNTKAFRSFSPGKEMWGTLAFEDLWPSMTDFDYNDLIVYYNFEQITTAENQVLEIIGRFTFPAVGASFENAFGIQFDNLDLWHIDSVSGNILKENTIQVDGNGLESGQAKPVVILTDNIENSLHRNNDGAMLNTVVGGGTGWSDTLVVRITLAGPLEVEKLGAAPYNPFIFRDQNRTVEIHLPNDVPTTLVDHSNFGTFNDGSDPDKGIYYLTEYFVPWVHHFPIRWKWPDESDDIINAYPNYGKWAESDGVESKDWYVNPDPDYEGPWK